MTHRISDESLDETMDESIEQKWIPVLKLTQRKWGILLAGALVLVGGTWSLLQLTRSAHSPEMTSDPGITVATLTIRSQSIANTLNLSGTIRPLEQATLSTRVMGRITRLSLEAGDRFRKGDVLAQIDVMDMTAQTSQAQAVVVQAQSAVAQRQADLSQAQAMLNQLQAQKIEAQAALQLAVIDRQRMARLQAEGAVSQERLDQSNTALAQAKARVAQMDAGIRQAEGAIAQSQGAILQSRAAVDQAESSVTAASVSESYGTVIAPFDGVVVQKLAYEGELASPGTALLKVENPDRLQLEISVPEENLRWVKVGQPVQVRIDAVDQTLKARIAQIVPTADANSRSFLVKIPLNNSGRLISGMFGRIALSLDKKQEGVLIPTKALIQRGQLQGVYVVNTTDAKSTAVLRWVKTGQQRDGQVEIVSGLVEGDRIIINQLNQLSDGQPVNPQP